MLTGLYKTLSIRRTDSRPTSSLSPPTK